MHQADLNHSSSTLQAKLERLYTLNRHKAIDLSFRPPYLDLLKALGNPHEKLPPVIHVAGTNGKGSIVAMLRAILEAGGYSVHAYTSPHLVQFNDRIVLAGQQISDEYLEELIDKTLDLNKGGSVTFFEVTTAIAFKAFSDIPADIVLLEVGLGGRLDCTNIISKQAVSIVNKISYDHTEFLGSSIAEIVNEKNGIIKDSQACIYGYQNEKFRKKQCLNQAVEKCVSYEVPLYAAERDWCVSYDDKSWSFSFQDDAKTYPRPSLLGDHQVENAGAALAALKTIEGEFPVSDADIARGLQNVTWPGRMQRIETGVLTRTLNSDIELWYDGGHNDSAGEAIAVQLDKWNQNDPKPLHIVIGMKADKDSDKFLLPLLPFASSISVIPLHGVGECLRNDQVQELLKTTKSECHIQGFETLKEAVGSIKNGRILICGSLYLAQEVF